MARHLWWAVAGAILFLSTNTLCAPTTVTFKAATTTLAISRTWPADLASGEATLSASQAIQVLFSRAVLAPSTTATSCAAKVPFTLWCATSSVPAALSCQWLNASMVRWAPLHAWPPDLDCTLRINAALTAHDGAKLAPGQASWSASLRTKPLSWQVGWVTSGALRWHLGGEARVWQGAGRVAEVGYEVPPDGLVTLNLSHPVRVAALSQGLRVVEPPGTRHRIDLYACRQPWEMGRPPQRLTARSPDTACVALHFSPPLAKFQRYHLALPQGTRYSQAAGALSRTLTANVSGLHGFAIPFLPGERSPAQPRSLARVRLWLPRGLAPNVTAARLAAQVAVRRDAPFADANCPDATVKVLSSRLVRDPPTSRAPTHLELQLGRVCPGRTYRFTVAAAADVRDVLGMPLEASEGTATSAEPPNKPAPLLPINRPVVHMLPGEVPQAWPLVVPPRPSAVGSSAPFPDILAWAFSSQDAKHLELLAVTAAFLPASHLDLGPADAKVPSAQLEANGTRPQLVHVLLAPGRNRTLPDQDADIHVVGVMSLRTGAPYAAQVVLRAGLVAAWTMSVGAPGVQLTVHVTHAGRGNASATGPVQGAEAFAYAVQDPFYEYIGGYPQMSGGNARVLLGRCLTGADGACAIPMRQDNWTALPRSLRVVGLVRGARGSGLGVACTPDVASPDLHNFIAGPISGVPLEYYNEVPWMWEPAEGQGPPYPSSSYLSRWALRPRRYAGALVAHERVVPRGGLLHLTGWVAGRRRRPGGNEDGLLATDLVPNVTQALLVVYPSWPNSFGLFELVTTNWTQAPTSSKPLKDHSSSAAATATAGTSTGGGGTRRALLSKRHNGGLRAGGSLSGRHGEEEEQGPGGAGAEFVRGRQRQVRRGHEGGGRGGRHGGGDARRGRPGVVAGGIEGGDARGGGGGGGTRRLLSGPVIFAPSIFAVPVDPQTGAFHATLRVPPHAYDYRGWGDPAGSWVQLPLQLPLYQYVEQYCHVHLVVGRNGTLPANVDAFEVGNMVYTYPEPVERYNPDGGDTAFKESDYQWLAFQKFDIHAAQVPVDLVVRAPAWADPRGAIRVSAAASTGLGPTPRALVRFNWSSTDAQEARWTYHTGMQVVETDAEGRADLAIRLPPAPAASLALATVLRVSAVRYLPAMSQAQLDGYMQTVTIWLDASPQRLRLVRSVPTHLPGAPWAVRAVRTSNADGREIQGVPVRVTLQPAPGTHAAGNASCAPRPSSCTITTGQGWAADSSNTTAPAPACEMALPCAGAYTLAACTVPQAGGHSSPGGRTATCTNETVGLDAAGWAAAPLSTPLGAPATPPETLGQGTLTSSNAELADLPLLWADNPLNLTVGATARLSFHNPWALGGGGGGGGGTAGTANAAAATATAVLLWAGGGASGWRSRALPAAALRGRRVVRVELLLGVECEGDCAVLLLLTGAAPGGVDLPPGVTKSLTFDASMPATLTSRLVLRVSPRPPTQVEVRQAGPTGACLNATTSPAPSLVKVPAGSTLALCALAPAAPASRGGGAAEATFAAVPRSSLRMTWGDPLPDDAPPALDPPTRAHVALMAHTLLSPGVLGAVAAQQVARLRAAGNSSVAPASLAFPAPVSLASSLGLPPWRASSLADLPEARWVDLLVAAAVTDAPPPSPWRQQDPFASLADAELVAAPPDPLDAEVVPAFGSGVSPVEAERSLGTLVQAAAAPGGGAAQGAWEVPRNATGASFVARAYVSARGADGTLGVGASGFVAVQVT